MVRAIQISETVDNNNRYRTELAKENASIRRNTTGYSSGSADRPDVGIGTVERQWTNHKWVDRKRGPNGKWIYDYGYGYGNGDPGKIRSNRDKMNNLSNQNKNLKAEQKRIFDEDKKEKYPIEYAVKKGREFIANLFK